jgi:Family of unknown function (DUF5985)
VRSGAYLRTKARLLLRSSVCFFALTVNNVLLFVDKVILPGRGPRLGVHFQVWRSIAVAVGMVILVAGLICDSD